MPTEPTEGPAESGETAPPPARPRGPLGVLRHPEFALFWGGQVVSLVGTWMQVFAQSWVVTELTTSALALGLVNFASSIPTLILTAHGGVVADRRERRRILIYTQCILMLLAFGMGVLIATGRLQLWHIYAIAVLLGIVTAYELPAFQAFYPQLVPRNELPRAIPLNQAAFHGSRIIGPALASWFVQRWGTAAAFYANGFSFLAVVVALAFIRTRPPAGGGERSSTGGMLAEGIAYVRDRPGVQALLGLVAITTLCIFPNLAVLSPHYARRVLHVDEGGLAVLMSVSGAGALVGAMLLLSLRPEQRLPRMVFCVMTGLLTMSVLAWSRALWLSTAAMTLQSFAIAQSMGITAIMVQELVPDALRGRVMSLYTLMFTGIMPFGALAVSGLVEVIGMRLELQIAGLVYVTGGLLSLRLLRQAAPTVTPPAG